MFENSKTVPVKQFLTILIYEWHCFKHSRNVGLCKGWDEYTGLSFLSVCAFTECSTAIATLTCAHDNDKIDNMPKI